MTLADDEVPDVVIIWKFSVPLTAVWVLAMASPVPPTTAAAAAAVSAEAMLLRITGSPSGAIAAGRAPRVRRSRRAEVTTPSVPGLVSLHIGNDAYSGLR